MSRHPSEVGGGVLQQTQSYMKGLEGLVEDLRRGQCKKAALLNQMSEVSHFLESLLLDRTSFTTPQDEDIFSDTDSDIPTNVQDWITQTFTRRASLQPVPRKRLRSLVMAMRAGLAFERIFRRLSHGSDVSTSPHALNFLKEHLNSWTFDVFEFDELCSGHSLKVMAYQVLFKNNMVDRFQITTPVLDAFLAQLESGYETHSNPYHNSVHAADVLQTCHYLICHSPLLQGMSHVEMFGLLFAAMVHDFQHTGTSNAFHVRSDSELALIYNDKSVLENYHLSAMFTLLHRHQECNILANLGRAEYIEFRNLVIPLVLATDMSMHFNLVQNMRDVLLVPELLNKNDIFAYVLHCADISHPCKPWPLHSRWTEMLVEEFFIQGDREKALGLTCSPLCDRDSTLVAESQIGFIDYIVEPCYVTLDDMLDSVSPLFTLDPPLLGVASNRHSPDSHGHHHHQNHAHHRILHSTAVTRHSPRHSIDSFDAPDHALHYENDDKRESLVPLPTSIKNHNLLWAKDGGEDSRPWVEFIRENREQWTIRKQPTIEKSMMDEDNDTSNQHRQSSGSLNTGLNSIREERETEF